MKILEGDELTARIGREGAGDAATVVSVVFGVMPKRLPDVAVVFPRVFGANLKSGVGVSVRGLDLVPSWWVV